MQDGWDEYHVDEDIPIPNTWADYSENNELNMPEDELTVQIPDDHVDDDDDDETELREEYDPHLSYLFDACWGEPLGYHRLREYIPNKAPPYFKDNLFKIGHTRTLDEQMNKLWDELEKLGKTMSPWDEVCKLIVQLTSNKDEYSFVTEGDLAQMLWYCLGSPHSRKFLHPSIDPNTCSKPTYTSICAIDKDELSEKDTNQLYNDIAKVVREIESPADFKVDEYTHWMMTFLREEVQVAETEMIYQAIGVLTMPAPVGFTLERFHFYLYHIIQRLVRYAKDRMKNQLSDVVQPLGELCNPDHYNTCVEIGEIVQIAELRRMALGSRFIGRSHLIWAFYKLGYALPLEIRNTIKVHEADEDHPPYHIYMAARKLALLSGEKTPQLVHFIFAVLHSKDIGSDGERVTEMYQEFKDFQKALESMETDVEPKSTVTVRPCGPVDSWLEGPFTV